MKSDFLPDSFMFKDSERACWVQLHLRSPSHPWSTLCRAMAKLQTSPRRSSLEHQFALASLGPILACSHSCSPPESQPFLQRQSSCESHTPQLLLFLICLLSLIHIPPNFGFAHCFTANSRWSINFWGVNEFGRQAYIEIYMCIIWKTKFLCFKMFFWGWGA